MRDGAGARGCRDSAREGRRWAKNGTRVQGVGGGGLHRGGSAVAPDINSNVYSYSTVAVDIIMACSHSECRHHSRRTQQMKARWPQGGLYPSLSVLSSSTTTTSSSAAAASFASSPVLPPSSCVAASLPNRAGEPSTSIRSRPFQTNPAIRTDHMQRRRK